MSTPRRLPAIAPDKFWSFSGEEPPLPWPQWQDSFQNYINLLDADSEATNKLSSSMKNVLLQQLLGNAGLKAFSAHPEYENKNTLDHEKYLAVKDPHEEF